jgi:hypothetical protein
MESSHDDPENARNKSCGRRSQHPQEGMLPKQAWLKI